MRVPSVLVALLGLGVYHGLRRQHLQAYLDEFGFRLNRRHTPAAAFERLLGLLRDVDQPRLTGEAAEQLINLPAPRGGVLPASHHSVLRTAV
jgi:hypothetical protein